MPKVALLCPGAKQVCPKSAACWSPMAAATGTPGSTVVQVPKSPVVGSTRGSIAAGTPKTSSIRGSQSRVRTWSRLVRLALVTSVTCRPPSAPPVRFHTSQVSIVPKHTSPRSARSASPRTWPSSQRSRDPAKYVDTGAPVRSTTRSPCPASRTCWTTSPARVSSHVMTGVSGRPLRRSQTRHDSRWLAMPRATTCPASAPMSSRACGTTCCTCRQISSGSCSDQPGCGWW